MKADCFIHIQGGKLYGTIITGQVLWDVLMFRNGLNPLEARPSLTLHESNENPKYILSNDFHVSPSVGCLNTPSFVRSGLTIHVNFMVKCVCYMRALDPLVL
jgi:hypothetical protein